MIDQAKLLLRDRSTTQQLADLFCQIAPKSATVWLSGQLGTGKTAWVQAVAHSLGWSEAIVSPTFSLAIPYQHHDQVILHMDLYRLSSAQAWQALGVETYFEQPGWRFIEWAEKADSTLPAADMNLCWAYHQQDETSRELTVYADSQQLWVMDWLRQAQYVCKN